MRRKYGFFAVVGVVAAVSACTPPQPVAAPIQAEPIFNKYGNPTGQCTNDYTYDSQQQVCLPPPPPNCGVGAALTHATTECQPPRDNDGGNNGGGNIKGVTYG